MKTLIIASRFFFQVCGAIFADVVRVVLVNDDDPCIVRATDGTLYKAEWYYGDVTWFEGDRVILTRDNGRGKMISIGRAREEC